MGKLVLGVLELRVGDEINHEADSEQSKVSTYRYRS